MNKWPKWGLILGVWGAVLLSGASASAEPLAAVKASPALVAQAAKRAATVVAVRSAQQFKVPTSVVQLIIDDAAKRFRDGLGLTDASEERVGLDSLHLNVKPRGPGATVSLSYQF